jgi:hypothetical protein
MFGASMILTMLRRIKRHGRDLLFRGKNVDSFPSGICHRGKYYYNQLTHLNEEHGCAITCLAMLFSNYHGKFIPPATVFWWNLNQVYVHWNMVFFRAGLPWEEINLADKTGPEKQALIKDALKTHREGIMAHFYDRISGYKHYIVINKTEAGVVGVADPMACNSQAEPDKGRTTQTEDIGFEQSFTYYKFGGARSWDFLHRVIMIKHGGKNGV